LREYAAFVVPGASKSKVSQQPDGTLRILTSAPASGNRANKAVIELVAKWAGVFPESVSIVSGFRGRRKRIRVQDMPDPQPISRRMAPIINQHKTQLIKELRELGGEWKAERQNFGTYVYEGSWNGSKYEIRSYAHLAPQYEGDDETFSVYWHITKDGESFGYPTKDPVAFLREA